MIPQYSLGEIDFHGGFLRDFQRLKGQFWLFFVIIRPPYIRVCEVNAIDMAEFLVDFASFLMDFEGVIVFADINVVGADIYERLPNILRYLQFLECF